MPKPVETTLSRTKDCKYSIVYSTQDPEAPITNIYLKKTFAKDMPDHVKVTVVSAD